MITDFLNSGSFPEPILPDTKIELDVVFDENVPAVSFSFKNIQ